MSEVKTDKISSVSTNGDITLDPDGTGDTIVASGNVGFGNTAPYDVRVHISGDDNDEDPTLGSPTGALIVSNTDTAYGLQMGVSSGGEGWIQQGRVDGTATAYNLHLQPVGGNVLVGTTQTFPAFNNVVGCEVGGFGQISASRDGAEAMQLNRKTSDGSIALLKQDGTTEGSITVSGTTVSFNGGHISRWSRLLDGSKPTALLKGTVMSNLDDMIVWTGEDNEQLNHTKVSDTEGDVNAAGVFVSWDNDDEDYNDFFLAMTGDMVIRIASGTTVARGDLLMSAGDGTAKPQGDDIVRSKTIAKVTSTNVSHTYDDGSYLVPCVLMAC